MHVVEGEDSGGGDEGAEGDADDVGDGVEGRFLVSVEAGFGVVWSLQGWDQYAHRNGPGDRTTRTLTRLWKYR